MGMDASNFVALKQVWGLEPDEVGTMHLPQAGNMLRGAEVEST